MIDDARIYCKSLNNDDIVSKFIDDYGHEARKCTLFDNAYIIEDTGASDIITLVDQMIDFSKDFKDINFVIECHKKGSIEASKIIEVSNGKFKKSNFATTPILHEPSSKGDRESRKNKKGGVRGTLFRNRKPKNEP